MMHTKKYNLLTILGPTASGKTSLAANIAYQLQGEIISADSRQVYRKMDIGTGKDLDDYTIHNTQIPYHLIDIAEPGEKYNVYKFQHDFIKIFKDILQRGRFPIMSGGTGLYIEAILKGYDLITVPPNASLRAELNKLPTEVLISRLAALKKLHNTTDTKSRDKLIKAIEIAEYTKHNKSQRDDYPDIKSLVIGIKYDRLTRRESITSRLKQRLSQNALIKEVEHLLEQGVQPEQLIYYGLEYKYVTLYITGKLTYDEMFNKLNTAIHQFAKRQMTWFRKMERQGTKINWLDGELPLEEKTQRVLELLS